MGDGPWDAMHRFDDNIPHRAFVNFQFVSFMKIMSENKDTSKKELEFALAVLMERPIQYKATQRLSILESDNVGLPCTMPLPPPPEVIDHDNVVNMYPPMTSFQPVVYMAPVEQPITQRSG
ncbi:hypothetical protein IFM89_004377 [Coptis chinensis]|uniref:Copine C-terminal domain-containing protein n=1 Tax=Coptis chinensis TaxID=261450 RepID=A0A835INX0_9MAGN|nr:hypothetical protein IFM89_004377 [Coptis chinensis]